VLCEGVEVEGPRRSPRRGGELADHHGLTAHALLDEFFLDVDAGRGGAAKVVPGEVQRDGGAEVRRFFKKAFVSRVKRRMCLRIVRFWRSTPEVLIRSKLGHPRIAVLRMKSASRGGSQGGVAEGRIYVASR